MRLLTKKQLFHEKGLCGSDMALHRLRQDPAFPMPREVGSSLRWVESEIDEWIDARPKIRSKAAPKRAA